MALGREEELKGRREPIGADRRPPSKIESGGAQGAAVTPFILVVTDRRSAVPAAAAMNRDE